MKREIAFGACLLVVALSIGSVLFSPGFSRWWGRESAEYYIAEGMAETNAPSILGAIVWDFRAFDTLGEEIVLFTAAVGVFTVMVFGISEKGKRKEKIGR
jgi:multicomponent Na+:H+ antiporter subunit A